MSLFQVVFRALDRAGVSFIESRREDGHGSVSTNPTFIQGSVRANDSAEYPHSHYAGVISSDGDTTLITPAPGKRLRVFWIYAINQPTSSVSPVISISIGSRILYKVFALSKRQIIEGDVDQSLTINLSAPSQVAVTVIYEEF